MGFFADIGKTRITENATRKRAIAERSDRAAEELVVTLDEAREFFLGAYRHGSGPEYRQLRPTFTKIRQKAILLGDPRVREQIELAVEVFSGYVAAEHLTGDVPSTIAYRAWNEARETLARALNDQPFVASDILRKYKEAIDEDRAIIDEMEAEARKDAGGSGADD